MFPQRSSPARDAGDPAFSGQSTDQRGQARVQNGRIDMGSVESLGPDASTTTTTTTTQPAEAQAAQAVNAQPNFTG